MLQSSDLPEKNTEKLKIKCFFIIFLNLVFYFLNVSHQRETIQSKLFFGVIFQYTLNYIIENVNFYAVFHINIPKSIPNYKLKAKFKKFVIFLNFSINVHKAIFS